MNYWFTDSSKYITKSKHITTDSQIHQNLYFRHISFIKNTPSITINPSITTNPSKHISFKTYLIHQEHPIKNTPSITTNPNIHRFTATTNPSKHQEQQQIEQKKKKNPIDYNNFFPVIYSSLNVDFFNVVRTKEHPNNFLKPLSWFLEPDLEAFVLIYLRLCLSDSVMMMVMNLKCLLFFGVMMMVGDDLELWFSYHSCGREWEKLIKKKKRERERMRDKIDGGGLIFGQIFRVRFLELIYTTS